MKLKCKAFSRLQCFTDLFFIVGQGVLLYGDNVHVRVAVIFPDFLQLWIQFINISIQLKQKTYSSALKHLKVCLIQWCVPSNDVKKNIALLIIKNFATTLTIFDLMYKI